MAASLNSLTRIDNPWKTRSPNKMLYMVSKCGICLPLCPPFFSKMENEEMRKVTEANGINSREYKEQSIAVEANGKAETHEVARGKKYEVVGGKVDWRGRPALRGRHGGVANSFFILVNFGLENLASLSLAVNLIIYFMTVMHIGLTDGSNLLTNYMGTSYMVAVLISVFADTFIGRYKTVILSSVIELVGLLILTLQAHSKKLKPPHCFFPFDPTCQTVSGDGKRHLYVGLYLVAIGSAGIKAALPAHCADQFDEKHPTEKLQMSSFFNWLLLSLCTGGAISVTVFVWIQNNKGWDKGFGAATGVMGLAVLVFIAGVPGFRMSVVQGSTALLEIFQVYVAAIRNRNLKLPENPDELYEISKSKAPPDTDFMAHRDKPFRFLDKASIVQEPMGAAPSPWRQCRVTQVEHAKTVLAMVPIFCSAIIMSTCLAQLQTFSIQQGATMDTSIGTFKMPAASLPIIPLIILIFAVPIYERGFVPFARRITGHPNGIPHLQRVGVGLVLSIVSMSIAAVVEVRRKKVAARHGMLDANPMRGEYLPISCFWLAPQFTVFGIADMFTYIGLLEFFYSQAPPALKSMSSSFLWCPMSLGYFLSTIIVKAVNAATKGSTASGGWLAGNNINRNHLDLFFWLLAVLSFINFLNYLFWASWYKYKPQQSAIVPAEQNQV